LHPPIRILSAGTAVALEVIVARDPYAAIFRAQRWHRVHLALTILLLVALMAFGGLAAAGRLHFGLPRGGGGDGSPGAVDKPDKGTGGRYQIEAAEDTRQLLNRLGDLGFLGQPILETWVFRYTGGYLECRLESEHDGQVVSAGVMPNDMPGILRRNEAIRQGRGDAFLRQGYIVVAAMQPVLDGSQALAPYRLSLGGLFVRGPAGPLHPLINLHMETRQPRRFRLFLSIDPPPGGPGGKLHLWAEQEFQLRVPFVRPDPDLEDYQVAGGRKLTAGRDITLLDRKHGISRLRLRARFLPDGEVRDLATRPEVADLSRN
jgi:hypothetical protein